MKLANTMNSKKVNNFLYLVAFSVALNIYTIGIWIFIFNTTNSHFERVEKFRAFFLGIPQWIPSIIALILSIVSVIILFRYKIINKPINLSLISSLIIIVLQILFSMLFIFQHL